ncbi:MAG: hypothetical protein KDD45_06270 [Bdellovibrionales bacterium]|nr:hypothetical protein [Bdellovibrionales bacterium]
MNPIPPQAYTRDSLLKAYSWLQNQDSSIKEMATTPDILVSLYLKATRDGDAVLDRPSIQNFKHELKQLAGMMGEFEKEIIEEKIKKQKEKAKKALPPFSIERAIETFSPVNQQGFPQTNPTSDSPQINELNTEKIKENISQDNKATSLSVNPQVSPSVYVGAPNGPGEASSLPLGLDAKSLMVIAEVKNQLNLTSESEALRLLIQTGFNKVKKLF